MRSILAVALALSVSTPAMAQSNTDKLKEYGKQRLQDGANATGDWRASLPPAKYDRDYSGQLVVTKWNDYSLIRSICKDTKDAVACSYFTYDTASGHPISCLIMLGPVVWNDERAFRHERGHCNGWGADHAGERP
jgi:hypothetical protein